MSESPRRVLLYSHDSFGLGHLRRTLTLACEVAGSLPGVQVLIASGSPCATHFAVPNGVEIIKLPAVTKDESGAYTPRTLGKELGSLLELRQRLLLETFRAFAPDLLIVDHQPIGLRGELWEVLLEARRTGTTTFLGLRDIIDEPAAVAREWGGHQIRESLRSLYDRVFVYGSPRVFDTREEYPIPPELREHVEFAGYVVRENRRTGVRPVPALRPQVLVTAGGGEDGYECIQTYIESIEQGPVGWDTTVVLGPLMDPQLARRIKRRARLLGHIKVHQFHADMPRLLAEADAVVAMAGYNTVAEILQHRVPAVLVPRTFPRREQAIRAERLAALGLVDSLTEPTAATMRRAVEQALVRETDWSLLPDLDGRRRVSSIVADHLCGTELEGRDEGAQAQVS